MIRVSIYHPRKRKRQRRQRGRVKQRSKRNYLSNPGKHRLESRMRYQHHYKRNPRYKRKSMLRRKFPMRYRRLAAEELDQHAPHLEGIWFMLPDGDDFQIGHVHKIWGADWMIEYELEDGSHGEMDVDEFLDTAVLEDPPDVDMLHDILEQAAKIRTDKDDDVVWEFDSEKAGEAASFEKPDAPRVAARHRAAVSMGVATQEVHKAKGELDYIEGATPREDMAIRLALGITHLHNAARALGVDSRLANKAESLVNALLPISTGKAARVMVAFNKENPSELLNQMVRVLSKAADSAEGRGKKGLEDALSEIKGLTKTVQDAWTQRKAE